MKKFKLYYEDGKTLIIKGENIKQALDSYCIMYFTGLIKSYKEI